MKPMKKELGAVIKSLKALVQQTQKIAKELSNAAPKRGVPAGRRRVRAKARVTQRRRVERPVSTRGRSLTATDAVFGIIRKGKKGVTTTQIQKKTGFDDKKIWNVINRLKTQRKIKSARRGIYVTTGK